MTNQPQRNICDTAPESLPYFGSPFANRSALLEGILNLLPQEYQPLIKGLDLSPCQTKLTFKTLLKDRSFLFDKMDCFQDAIAAIDPTIEIFFLEAIDVDELYAAGKTKRRCIRFLERQMPAFEEEY